MTYADKSWFYVGRITYLAAQTATLDLHFTPSCSLSGGSIANCGEGWRGISACVPVRQRCNREVRCKTGAAPATVSGGPAATSKGLVDNPGICRSRRPYRP